MVRRGGGHSHKMAAMVCGANYNIAAAGGGAKYTMSGIDLVHK